MSAAVCGLGDAENWRPVVGFPGYEVSDMGRVRSFRKAGGRVVSVVPDDEPKILTLIPQAAGYPTVSMGNGGKRQKYLVHALVLEAFVGPRQPGMVARHFPDREPTNVRLSNLQWGTEKENAADKEVHGTVARGDKHGLRLHPGSMPTGDRHWSRRMPEAIARGERQGGSKLTPAIIASAKERHASGESFDSIAASIGVAMETVRKAVRGLSWRHLDGGQP